MNIHRGIKENKTGGFEIAEPFAQRWGGSVIEDKLDYRCDKACHRMGGQLNMLPRSGTLNREVQEHSIGGVRVRACC